MTEKATMRGMVLTGHGGLDKLEWRDDLPVPEQGAGEVLIKVGAAAVNNTDINTRTGWYSKAVRGDTASGATQGYDDSQSGAEGSWSGEPLAFPLIQGADCCGQIVAVGAGVEAGRIGERVLVRTMQSRTKSDGSVVTFTFGSECNGGFAEYAVAASRDALKVSSDLTDIELAVFPCAFSTAEAMIQRCGLGSENVLITGASGGVGSAAIQLAKRRGAHVTAVTASTKAEALRQLGADETLDRDTIIPATAFDVILDVVGGPQFPGLIDGLRDRGRYVTSGAIAGPIVELDLRTLYLRDLTLLGSTYQPESVFEDLVGYIEAGDLKPVVAATYPLSDLRSAQDAFVRKSHIGKIGIRVSD
ncbi:MAG: alcohol dehydrogenase family protein [Hoeflea sp.]|uniref:alcohol dehydrogenase family protein n=1 Tax=Hoeflea sp. TaxID=1940281 RepID=UPI0032EFD952